MLLRKPKPEEKGRPMLLLYSLASVTFITRVGFSASTLAYMLDSLVRVSRRDGKNHFDKIARSPSAFRKASTPRVKPKPRSHSSSSSSIDSSCLTTPIQLSNFPLLPHQSFDSTEHGRELDRPRRIDADD